MVDFSSSLNHGKAPLWLCSVALIISLGSAFFQSFLIGRYDEVAAESKSSEPELHIPSNPSKKNKKILWCEYFGKVFMASEIVLSLANTAFSSHSSSMDDVIDMFHQNWLSDNSKYVGLGLFILSIIVFIHVTLKHFNIYSKSRLFCYPNQPNATENCQSPDESSLTC